MATAAVQVPSSNSAVPGSHFLTVASYPRSVTTAPPDAEAVSSFNSLIGNGDGSLASLFLEDCYWRDLLCLTWDFHTLHSPEKIASFIRNETKGWRIRSLSVDSSTHVGKPKVSTVDFEGTLKGIQSFLTVETDVGRGRGLVRLLPDAKDKGKWKAFTLFTTLQELKGHEELNQERRPTGLERDAGSNGKNWKEKRTAEENFEGDLEPAVLIIGKVCSFGQDQFLTVTQPKARVKVG
ncbi:MAG: hypothetical protein Q9187_005940 [Circinaria calcarea]